MKIAARFKRSALAAMLGTLAMLGASPAAAQIQTIDPDAAIDGDLGGAAVDAATEVLTEIATQAGVGQSVTDSRYASLPVPENAVPDDGIADRYSAQTLDLPAVSSEGAGYAGPQETVEESTTTYKQDDLIGAAEGVFGDGAEGIAGLIEKLLKDQGEPNGYIVGREGGGAFVIGVRYGSGTLFHKVEGEKPAYWTGPSIGIDAGANIGKTFMLVYNLYDSEDLYKRFPAGEGQLYFLGGFNVSYLRRGNIVLIPIRVGAGMRVGVNAGYMRFSKKHRWLPF